MKIMTRKVCRLFIYFVTSLIELRYMKITDFQILNLESYSNLKCHTAAFTENFYELF